MIIERLGASHLEECVALAESRNWWPERTKWGLLLDVGIAFGVRDGDGRLIGTTIVTRYSGLAAISMVLVAKELEGQGIGRKLMTAALEVADRDIVCLNATDMGRPLYEKLGFVTVGSTETHVGVLQPQPSLVSRRADSTDWATISRLDSEANGTDRSVVLQHLPAFAEQVRVTENGYGASWRNGEVLMIGPVVAESAEEARHLISDLADGTRTRLDLDARHPELREWATAQGLPYQYSTAVMAYNGKLPGDRDRWFMPFMQALG